MPAARDDGRRSLLNDLLRPTSPGHPPGLLSFHPAKSHGWDPKKHQMPPTTPLARQSPPNARRSFSSAWYRPNFASPTTNNHRDETHRITPPAPDVPPHRTLMADLGSSLPPDHDGGAGPDLNSPQEDTRSVFFRAAWWNKVPSDNKPRHMPGLVHSR